jgi:exopolysaccharide biosynthesis protein
MEKEKNVLKPKKKSKLAILLVFIMQLFTASLVSCLLIYYGPFSNLRRTLVGTAMSTYKHQYIAKMFLSDAKIAEILSTDSGDSENAVQTMSNVNVQNYNDSNIEQYDISGTKFKGYLLVIKNPLRVKVGYTKNLGEQGETTSDIAKDHNAIAAINGGGFTDKSDNGKLWAGTGAYPTGFVFSNGKIAYQDKDIKSDVKLDTVALDTQGKLIIGKHSINDLKTLKVSEAITFGPVLLVDGNPAFSGDGGQGITARTAIGQRKDGAILLLVLDGRRLNMPGATLHDLQKIMKDYNAYNAVNLDGGSSTTMYYKGKVINSPCDPLGERSIATALYVTP